MKSIFQSKTVWIMAFIVTGYGIYKHYEYLDKVNSPEIVVTTPGEFNGLTDKQVELLIEIGVPLILGGGGIVARARGDKEMYTPHALPGRNKTENATISDDSHIDII